MGDVDRQGRTSSLESDDGGGAAHGAPGKRPRTAAIQRRAISGPGPADAVLGSGAQDVSATAAAAVAPAFGDRAAGIDYTVGGGAAEARDVNALTTDRKVDFAPGRFDLGTEEGKARVGEETAHAVQQANPGPASPVDDLEGEARRAGADFAAGQTPTVNLAAPAGLGLADDPKAPKDTDPSAEVPDLLHGEVVAIKAVLASDRAQALQLMLAALQRKDATAFASTDLDGGKLHHAGGSSTVQGPKFEAWLDANLTAFATAAKKDRDKLSSDEIKKSIKATPPPADKKDIRVEIGTGHFKSVSLLYSTVRHEFVHVAQLRTDYTAYLPSSVMPSGVSAPDGGHLREERELEAYLWEMENLAGSGLKDEGEIHLLWEQCSNGWLNAGAAGQAKFKTRFEAAFAKIWKLGVDAHVAAIGKLHADFKTSGTVDDGRVRKLKGDLDQFWAYRVNFGIPWQASEGSYDTATAQATEMLAVRKVAEVTTKLDDADKAIKAGFTDAQTAYRTWWPLFRDYDALDATSKKGLEARAKVTLPALWDQAFTLYEAKINGLLASDPEEADTLLYEKIGTLWKYRAESFIVQATYATRKQKLDDDVAKAKQK